MGMSIRTNVSSLEAQRNLYGTQSALDSSLSKLSSGYRITKAGDDAAGLGISSALQAQIKSYNQASRNASDGVSLLQTAEGGLNETTNILTRLRELSMQSASSGVTDTERGYIQSEVGQLLSEIDRIANTTEFNGVVLTNGTSTTLTFQVGIRNNGTNDRISVNTVNATQTALGVNGLSLATMTGAQQALGTIDSAIQSLSNNRATLGAAGNRFQSVMNAIQISANSVAAANSRIRDVDVAQETSNLTRSQILLQAGVSTLSQANQIPQIALRLLG